MNYIIEEDLNFYDILNESIEKDDDTYDNTKYCLLTKTKLEPFHIRLDCGHAFNYVPLFNEIVNQKYGRTRHREIVRLRWNQFKCPYCRTVYNELIPFVKFKNTRSISRVNAPSRYTMQLFKCSHVFNKGIRAGKVCNRNINCENLVLEDGKYLCKTHMKSYLKKKEKESVKIERCKAILKSGKNKGSQCKFKSKCNGLCNKHQNATI